jgi:hypothetical protein
VNAIWIISIILAPLIQLITALTALNHRQHYLKRSKSLRSLYSSTIISLIPWLTYGTFIAILLNLWWRTGKDSELIIFWAKLSLLNWIAIPLLITCAILPPYPPKTWASSLNRLSAIVTAIGAWWLTHTVFPMN